MPFRPDPPVVCPGFGFEKLNLFYHDIMHYVCIALRAQPNLTWRGNW